MGHIVEIEGVNKVYGKNHVVKDLNLTVEEGEFLTLLGSSGCGKTTTLRMIAGFEEPTTGSIKVEGENLELKRLQKKLNITFIYVTHDQEEALTMSDRIAIMHDGILDQLGTPTEIYESPATKFVATFIGETNIFDGTVSFVQGDNVQVMIENGFISGIGEDFRFGEYMTVSVWPEKMKFSCSPVDGFGNKREWCIMGMKWYGSNMANKEKGLPRSILTVMLNDKDTGAPLCLMSANLLSAYRTGAIPGVGAKYLVRKDATVCGICGPGVMGKTSLAAILATCPGIDTVKVKGRGKASLERFVDYVKEEYPQLKTVEAVETVEDLVRDSDVLSFANTGGTDPSTYPFVKKEWIKPGAVLIGVSCFDMDDEELKECSLVVDNMQLYEAWEEEFPYPSFGANNIIGSKFTDMAHDGIISKEEITDLGDIIFGKKPGRVSEDQIFVYSVGGMPVEDVAWGKICYERAMELGLGVKLRLWDKPDLC